jgi:two-component system, OmpR family, KDP operon response regulator KdpE
MISARVLVVDDEPQLRRVMRGALTKQGHIVADARTAEAALEMLRKDRFDLVLLDRNLPGMGGVEACHSIRQHSDIGIIMLTVRKGETDRIEALDAGADDYVTKPFSMPELLARIRANLRRVPLSPRQGPSVITFEGIGVDLNSHHVTVRGKDVRLTPKQAEVLHYLVMNPNAPIPHSKLLQTIWGPDYGNEVEYLHVVINQLRKKLEPDPSKPRYILTEPWVGYRFRLDPEQL